ncbi:MAG: amino acid adenylation domain-containing protein [Longicatena sp.]
MYNILDYLENSAKRFPDKVAFADVEKEITYKELVQKAKHIGSQLTSHYEQGMPVPIFMEKSVDAISLFFGVVYAGCFYVMLDTKQPKTRLTHIMETLESKTIMTSQKHSQDLSRLEFEGEIIVLEELTGSLDEEKLNEIRNNMLDIMPLYGIFTSGSTGIPKGVTVAHRSVIDFIDTFTETFEITENDIIGNQAPWDFDVSVKDIYSTIKTGATMQIIPKQYFSMPSKLLDFMCEREITTIIWAVSAVCIISTLKGFDYKIPEKLTKVMFSGEVMPIKQFNIWKQYLPNAMYVNLYGPTEITCNCTYYIIEKDYELGQVIPIGKPFSNEKVFLLDDSDKEVKNTNVMGEICVSGTAVSLGYYNNKEQTEKAFCQNPLNKYYLETIYRTGDLGYYNEEGLLCFASRKDFQIKHMGHRIELGEIENMMDKVEVIKRSCCIFENNKIIAFYDGEIERKELIRYLKKDLPVFMIPNVFMKIDGFPITKNGKIDRQELIKMIKEESNV